MHRDLRSEGTSTALDFGSLWHKILEVWYKTGDSGLVSLVCERWLNVDSGDYRTAERAWLDFAKYRKQWGDSPAAENSKTIGWPDAPLVECSINTSGEGLAHPWAGKIDRIVDINGLLYVQDHKTTSRLDKHYFSQFENSNQMMGYTYLANQLVPGQKVQGVQINVIHTLKDKTNFQREIITYSASVLEAWAQNVSVWMKRLAKDISYHDFLVGGEEKLAATDARDLAFPGHYGDNGCSRKFGMCVYHEVCSASPKIQERLLQQNFTVKPWNPLEVED
jgi:hypothetical protein